MAKKGKKNYKSPAQKKGSTKKEVPAQKEKIVAKAVAAVPKKAVSKTAEATFIFGRINYIYMLAGAACLAIGLLLMTGGAQPDPNTWDDSIIYSHRRITLAPIMMIIGLVLEVMAIFKR